MPARRLVASALLVLLAACSSDPSSPSSPSATGDATQVQAQLATSDLYVDAPQRVQIGLVATDPAQGVLLVTSGEMAVELAPAGGGEGTPVSGMARYVAAPGTEERPTRRRP